MNFRKISKGGWGYFQSKNLCRRFWDFKQGFFSMKLIQKSHFRVQGMFFQQLYWDKSKQDTLWRRHLWIPPNWECSENSSVLVTPSPSIPKRTLKGNKRQNLMFFIPSLNFPKTIGLPVCRRVKIQNVDHIKDCTALLLLLSSGQSSGTSFFLRMF